MDPSSSLTRLSIALTTERTWVSIMRSSSCSNMSLHLRHLGLRSPHFWFLDPTTMFVELAESNLWRTPNAVHKSENGQCS